MKQLKTFFIQGLFLLGLAATAVAGEVQRSQFTSMVIDREPTDVLEQISSDTPEVYFFSELSGLSGHTVTHRWNFAEQTLFEKSFTVGGDRWRVWSSKKIQPALKGNWSVDVIDQDGLLLHSATLTVN